MTPQEKKELAQKLSNHRFTVVAMPTECDKDSNEFKAKEKTRAVQAKQRTQRANEIKAQKANNNGLHVKANKSHRKYNTTLASALDKALS